MRDYLLFVDTETSGLPKDWQKPYSREGNWPYIVQVAWIIYTQDGREVKAENHFINNQDFEITDVSARIHGITRELLLKNGTNRKTVMTRLQEDLQTYQPLIIGHFVQLDFHMLSAGFYRAGIDNPLKKLPFFCTMRATTHYCRHPQRKYLDLGALYTSLFDTPLEHQHDAMVDAKATAKCFFELLRRGDIDADTIARQQISKDDTEETDKRIRRAIILLAILLFTMLMLYLL